MEIIMLTVGQVCTNCYIIHQEGTNSCVVIDPGDEAKKIADQIRKNGWDCEGILLTHGHFDHATDAKPLADRYGIKIYIHEADKATLDDPQLNVSYMMGQSKTFYADVFLKDKQELDIAGFHIVVLRCFAAQSDVRISRAAACQTLCAQ